MRPASVSSCLFFLLIATGAVTFVNGFAKTLQCNVCSDFMAETDPYNACNTDINSKLLRPRTCQHGCVNYTLYGVKEREKKTIAVSRGCLEASVNSDKNPDLYMGCHEVAVKLPNEKVDRKDDSRIVRCICDHRHNCNVGVKTSGTKNN